jgi:hypothetical protein
MSREKFLYAYAPTEELWNALADAATAATDAQGEIATDIALPPALPATSSPFQLLSSVDGGVTWTAIDPPRFDPILRQRRILPYPIAVASADAQAIVLFGGTARDGQPWRDAWRFVP